MKKLQSIILLLTIVTLLGSCAKTTKGKISKDWRVTNYSVNTTLKDGGTSQLLTKGNETDAKTTFGSSSGTTPQDISISIKKNTLSIDKDGEWEQDVEFDYSYIDSSYGQNEASAITMSYSFVSKGTWSFMSKNASQDLKKNEIIHFYSTSLTGQQNKVTTNSSGTTSTSSDLKSVFTGDVADMGLVLPAATVQMEYGVCNTWKVKSSTRKELVLEHENKIDQESGSGSQLLKDTKLEVTFACH